MLAVVVGGANGEVSPAHALGALEKIDLSRFSAGGVVASVFEVPSPTIVASFKVAREAGCVQAAGSPIV